MFGVVKLTYNKYIVVPTEWIKEFDIPRSINNGVKNKKLFTIFYSHEKNKKPEYHMDVSPWYDFARNIDQKTDACYLAAIDRIYGKSRMIQYCQYCAY